MIRTGSVCADIGTDHARLCVYLVQNGICPSCIAADLREMPLKNAEKAVTMCGLTDKIKLRLSDGLDSISPDEADDFVFAGMGGTLIAELLARAEWIRGKHIVVQPMTHTQEVRRFLAENKFRITDEKACFDDGRAYVAFCADYDENYEPPKSELYYYIGGYAEMDNGAAKAYVEKQINWIKTRLRGLESASEEGEEVQRLRRALDEWGV